MHLSGTAAGLVKRSSSLKSCAGSLYDLFPYCLHDTRGVVKLSHRIVTRASAHEHACGMSGKTTHRTSCKTVGFKAVCDF